MEVRPEQFRPLQPSNAPSPMLVTLLGMVTEVRPSQYANALTSMLVTVKVFSPTVIVLWMVMMLSVVFAGPMTIAVVPLYSYSTLSMVMTLFCAHILTGKKVNNVNNTKAIFFILRNIFLFQIRYRDCKDKYFFYNQRLFGKKSITFPEPRRTRGHNAPC